MADFYKEKKMAIDMIDTMLLAGNKDAEIEYKLLKIYGFSKKMIQDRKELFERLKE